MRSYGRSIAVTTLFTNGLATFAGIDFGFDAYGCDEETFNMTAYRTMDELDFHWTYEKGDETIDMGYMNVEVIRLYLLRAGKALKSLDFQQFQDFYASFNYGEGTLDSKVVFDTLLSYTSSSKQQKLTVDDIRALTRKQLKFLGRSLDPPHGPRAVDGEEVFFMPGDMSDEKDEQKVERSSEKRREFEKQMEIMESNRSVTQLLVDTIVHEQQIFSGNRGDKQNDENKREEL